MAAISTLRKAMVYCYSRRCWTFKTKGKSRLLYKQLSFADYFPLRSQLVKISRCG